MLKFLINNKILQIKVIKILFYFSVFFILLTPYKSWAFFSLDKTIILFDELHKNNSITIYNMDNTKNTYKIYLEHYKLLSDERYKKVIKPEGFKFADKFIIYSPLSVTVQPHAYQVVRIQKKSMANVADGEYISYLSIKEYPKKVDSTSNNLEYRIKLNPIFKASLPIILTKGKLSSTYYIKDIKINILKDNYNIQTTLCISGNKTIMGSLTIFYNNQVLGTTNNIKLFPYIKQRSINVVINKNILQQFPNKVLRMEFNAQDGSKVQKTFNNY